MNDTLRYAALDPVYRRYNHQLITFSFVYAWSENFILPISHDEVVHGKRSLLAKMPGDDWQKHANFRLFLAYMCAHPGKKLLFMGSEFGQWPEWRDHDQLEWPQLAAAEHAGLRDCARELNHLYRSTPQLYGSDCDREGFRWVDLHNADESVWAFARLSADSGAPVTCVFNATPVPRDGYCIGVADPGNYRKVFDSDAARFGGSAYNQQSSSSAEHPGAQGYPYSLRLNLPPLAAHVLRRAHRVKVIQAGLPRPLGAAWTERGVNFALFSSNAVRVEVVSIRCRKRRRTAALRSARRAPADIWHGLISPRRACPGSSLCILASTGRMNRRTAIASTPAAALIDPYARAAVPLGAGARASHRRAIRLGRRSAARRSLARYAHLRAARERLYAAAPGGAGAVARQISGTHAWHR